MNDEQQPTETPRTERDGARIWIYAPFDSPYAMRLRRFNANWDFAVERWWVGVVKANALADLLARPLGDTCDEPPPQAVQQDSAAAALVNMAFDDYTLGITDTGEPYATHPDRPHVALMLRGGKTGLRAELAGRYWDAHQSPAPQQAIGDACLVLEGRAAREEPRRVDLRVAEHDGAVYIDVGDADCHVIEISGGEWYYNGCAAPVLFRRTKLTCAMPKPVAGGDLSLLWKFVPVHEQDRPLVLAWLVQALTQPDVPHPILALLAEHGSIKSTSTRCLAQMVDPSSVPLRKAPRDAEGWVTAANASWVVALDNLSGVVPLWLSDCLCRAVTGDGDVRRALYTDQDVSVIAFRRAVIINGIDIEVTQGDLADRLLRVDLPRVDERLEEDAVAAAWAEAWPQILGGLLDLAADVQHRSRHVTVPDLPRMADYAKVLATVDELRGTTGLARYREQSRKSTADTLDGSFIIRLIDLNYSCADQTSAEILAALKPPEEDWKRPKDWPKSARSVTAQLTRHAPALRSQGWDIEHDDGRNKDGVRRWTITPPRGPEKARNPDPPNPSDPSTQVNAEKSEGSEAGYGPEAGYDDPETGYGNLFNQPENGALTRENRSAGQAGYEYGSSLADEESVSPQLCDCGNQMVSSQSMARGHCERCHLTAKQADP